MGFDDRADGGLNGLVEQAAVPDDPEPPTLPQDPVKFTQGSVALEPVKGLGANDCVDGAILQRQGLGRSVQDLDFRAAALERLAHRANGLDREHPRARGDERSRQLPGTSADVDDSSTGPDPERLHQGGDDLCRVRRSSPLVFLARATESNGSHAVNARIHGQLWPSRAAIASSSESNTTISAIRPLRPNAYACATSCLVSTAPCFSRTT